MPSSFNIKKNRTARFMGLLAVFAAGWLSGGQAFAGSSMVAGGSTSQPIGHYEFCKNFPAECSIRMSDPGAEHMTKAVWGAVVRVNTQVNAAVKPMSDFDLYGKEEVWTYPVNGMGDCEDYVLEKRRELNQRGISLANLLITVVRKQDGEGHAVLTVRTDRGDFILDNLTDKVLEWDKTGYRFLKRQSSTNTGRWVTIREGSAPLVSAVQ